MKKSNNVRRPFGDCVRRKEGGDKTRGDDPDGLRSR